jgi:hypothetical protein
VTIVCVGMKVVEAMWAVGSCNRRMRNVVYCSYFEEWLLHMRFFYQQTCFFL